MKLIAKVIKSSLLVIFLTCMNQQSFSQVIFSEPFDEANTSTTGTDNTGGIGWAITCPGCTGSWDVDGNQWVINNTDAEAYWETTSPIDISSCAFIEITIYIEADGDFEDCGAGCNASDWIALETNIDGGGWLPPANSYLCNNGCPDTDIIFSTGTETGESITYTTNCMAGGSDLELRIFGQNWAGAEYWRIDDIQVSCSTGPTVGAGLDQTVCQGSDVTLTATNPDVAVITWDNGVTDGVPFTPPLGTTTYTTTATLGVCSATDQVDVTVTEGPTFSLNNTDASSCVGPFDGTITIGNLFPGQDYDLTYDAGGTVGPTTQTANGSGEIVITGLAPGSYTDFLIDSLGCTAFDATVINISSPGSPTVGAGADQVICEGQSVTLTANNPDVAVITWDNGVIDGVPFTPGVGSVNYTVTGNLAGCISTDVVNVTVNAIPTAAVDPAGPFAPTSGPQTITASPAGGTWSADCGACINATTGVFDPAVAGVGTWNICYTVGTAPCDDQDCIDITVTANCLLTGTPSGNNPTCFGFNDGSATIAVSGATGNLTFVITDDQGTVVNIGNSNTANNLSEGWYYFDVTDEFPCNYIDSVQLISPLQMTADLVVTDPLCYGVPTGLAVADTVYNYTGAYDQISYFWSPQTGGTNGLGEDTLFSAGEGQYTLLINDQNGCDETFDFTITYPDSLYLQEFGTESAYCRLYGYQSGNGVVYAAATGGVPDYDYLWTNLGTGQTSTNTTWGGRNPGQFQIQVTDNNGCVLTEEITLDSLNPIADFDLTSPQFLTAGVCEGTAVVDVHIENYSENFANPNNPNADTTFFWNFNHDLMNPGFGWQISHDVNEVYDTSYATGGVYTICLVALNKNGCSDTLCKPITVFDPLSFTAPNFFTPNDDGANDEFTFQYLAQAVKEFNCVIVNRWGIVIAELTNISDSWDGTDKSGSKCPAGVYFYTYSGQAENNDTFEGQGNVHLIEK
ncbi:MAG: gliding motility-associated C-terminal domain-containing protein [Crocinitomicaceae bacterium]